MRRRARQRGKRRADVPTVLNGSLHRYLALRLAPYRLAMPQGMHGCWVWGGATHPSGWQRASVDGRPISASHLLWSLTYGVPPKRPLFRTCETEGCLQIEHLTQVKPRRRREGDGGLSYRVRQLHRAGLDVAAIARRYRLKLAAVEQLVGDHE